MRFEQRHLLLERGNLRVESRDPILERLALPGHIHDVVVRLDTAEFEHQIAEDDDQQRKSQAHQDDPGRAVGL